MVSRGENKRYATLPDLGIVDCPSKEGPTKMKAVVLIRFPKNPGSFFLPRATIDPGDKLKKKLFPELDEIFKNYEGTNYIFLLSGKIFACLATYGHLKLLNYLREVFFQDCVAIQALYPDFSVFKHQIFDSIHYLSFKKRLEESLRSNTNDLEFLTNLSSNDDKVISHLKFTHSAQMAEFKYLRKEIVELKEITQQGDTIF